MTFRLLKGRRLVPTLVGAVALAVVPVALMTGASPADLDTSQFKGVNWARAGRQLHGRRRWS